MPTPHNEAQKQDIAKTVIMPGDPLRAKFIAETYLENAKLVNKVRGMLAYTGTYRGTLVTVMASGMGIPSMGIYSYELFHDYDVEEIIRIGTIGSLKESLALKDVILVDNSITDSTFAKSFSGEDVMIEKGSTNLNEKIMETAASLSMRVTKGNVYCDEAFYQVGNVEKPKIKAYDCLGIEMESFALFHIARKLDKKAATLLSVSNSLVTNEELSSEEREQEMTQMILLALESVTKK